MQSDPESRRAPSDLIPQSARPVQAPSDALPVPRQLQLFASALLRVQMVMIYNIFLLILQASMPPAPVPHTLAVTIPDSSVQNTHPSAHLFQITDAPDIETQVPPGF